MSNDLTEKYDPANLGDDKSGYAPPPFRFGEGLPENPFCRRRRKAQRNVPAVLTAVLSQTVVVKQDDKSERMTKGEAVIKTLMTMAQNGDHRAIDAISTLAQKIGRVDDNINSKTGGRVGIMLVPGVAASLEEWKSEIAKRPAEQEKREKLLKEQARTFRKWEAEYLKQIKEHEGTPKGDFLVSDWPNSKVPPNTGPTICFGTHPKRKLRPTFPKESRPPNCHGTRTNGSDCRFPRGRSMTVRIPKMCKPNRNRNTRRPRFIAVSRTPRSGVRYLGHSSLPTIRGCGTSRSATGDTVNSVRRLFKLESVSKAGC